MKLADIIDSFISGDWGEESPTQDTPNAAYCVRGADIVPITNHNFTDIPKRYVCDRTKETKLLEAGDLVIEKSGGSPTQSTGRIVYVSEDLIKAKGNVVCSNFCTAFRVKAGWNPLYVYYFWQNVYNHGAFFNFEGKTSGIKNLQLDNALSAIDIEYLPLEKQNQIVASLASIEEKIKVNRQINDNLSAMAKQLYDYWFVQFDFPNEEGKPYKSSGGAMVWNEKLKREIPQGWDSSMLQSICTIKRGASPRPIDDFMDESHKGMPWVKISDATNSNSPFMTTIKEHIILDGVPKSVKVIPNTLIVSNSATPGIPKFIQIEACVHDGWLVLTDYQEIYKYYLYYVIKMIRHNLLHIASGSIFKNLKTDYLKEFICITPSTEILSKYHNLVKPIMQEILLLQQDTEVLTKQRDELLPLLMNGQASVNYHLSDD